MIVFLYQLIYGLMVGSTYALIAIGLTMIYGSMRVLHIAHAGVYAVGAYLGLKVFLLSGNFVLSIIAAFLLSGFVGVLIERLLYRPLLPLPRIVPLIASIGLFVMLGDLLRVIFGPHEHNFPVEMMSGIDIGAISLSRIDLTILFITVLIIALLYFFIYKTKLGMAIRAVSQSLESSQMMGVNVNRVIQVVFYISSGMAGVAGVMVGVLYNAIYPSMGNMPAYKALAIIVIGGFGSVLGTILGGLFLGIAETLTITYTDIPLSRDGIAMLFLIIFILIRPQGFMGSKE